VGRVAKEGWVEDHTGREAAALGFSRDRTFRASERPVWRKEGRAGSKTTPAAKRPL
jgi:hypothetical protein